MVAHGFMLANLIRAQLATALIERMVAGGPADRLGAACGAGARRCEGHAY